MIFFVLTISGALVGALINWCIYNLGDKKLPISPWFATAAPLPHRLPIIGWWIRRSMDATKFGDWFWVRPLLIETVWTIGLPAFYYWQIQGGLSGGFPPNAPQAMTWFVGHSVLFALLFVATFIDFDQRIIPDGVTIPGTLIALVLAASFPDFRLPEVNPTIGGKTLQSLHYADGQKLGTWHQGTTGMGYGILIFAIWVLSLLPKFSLMGLNWKSFKIVFVSTIRFLQNNGLKVRNRTRKIGWSYLAIGAAGCIALVIGWNVLPVRCIDSLFGALIGLGFGGLMVWSVRIVASHSLGREAMGFGDVTLMAMIGAFLGWQPALLVFGISPFAALAIVLVNYLVTRENELAFGPYLCLAAVIIVFFWHRIWALAERQFFLYPSILIMVLAASLVLLMLMMLGLRLIKGDELVDDTQSQ